jgi:hypothetical protein
MPLPRGGFPAAASATAVVHPTLHRADSFTDEFKYDTTVVLAMRQQRVQAALENMQVGKLAVCCIPLLLRAIIATLVKLNLKMDADRLCMCVLLFFSVR